MLYSCTCMATVGVKLWQQSFLNDSAHPTALRSNFMHINFITRSTCSCCQTAYYWTSRLP